jgi:hypothetical protein
VAARAPVGAVPPLRLSAGKPQITIGGQLAELVRYCFDGWQGVGV